jgi:hypothetical protein
MMSIPNGIDIYDNINDMIMITHNIDTQNSVLDDNKISAHDGLLKDPSRCCLNIFLVFIIKIIPFITITQ